MTIEQTVEIPADHRIFFEFLAPKEIPAGPARVELKVTPVIKEQGRAMAKKEGIDQATPRADRLLGIAAHLNTDNSLTPHTDALLNIFSNLGDIDIDKIREERLAKHL